MKFKWIGENAYKDIDLVLNKVMTPQQLLFKGSIVDIPDDNVELIQRIKLNAKYEVYEEPKRRFKPKKEIKEETEEEE